MCRVNFGENIVMEAEQSGRKKGGLCFSRFFCALLLTTELIIQDDSYHF